MSGPADTGEIRGILFDKDGTLFDFRQMWEPAYRAAASAIAAKAGDASLTSTLLEAGGWNLDDGSFEPESPFISGSTDDLCRLWRATLGRRAPIALKAIVATVLEAWSTRPFPPRVDLEPLFRALVGDGKRLGIASMDSEAALRAMLADATWRRHIVFACGADSDHGVKPGPGMVWAFCQAVALDARDVAVVGDSLADLRMARAAGAGLAVAVSSGVTSASELAGEADLVIPGIEKLPLVLASSQCRPSSEISTWKPRKDPNELKYSFGSDLDDAIEITQTKVVLVTILFAFRQRYIPRICKCDDRHSLTIHIILDG